MTVQYFNYDSTYNGIRIFFHLYGAGDTYQRLKFLATEEEVDEALSVFEYFFNDTVSLHNKKKYQNISYNSQDDVRLSMQEYLLKGNDEYTSKRKQRKYTALMHLIIAPLSETLESLTPQNQANCISEVINNVRTYIAQYDQYGTSDDALIAQKQLSKIVEAREQKHLKSTSTTKRNKNKRSRIIEMDFEEDPLLEELYL